MNIISSDSNSTPPTKILLELVECIRLWSRELGFQSFGISDGNLSKEEPRLQQWLDSGFQGEMQWMADHGTKRTRPHELLPGTVRVISVRMDYLPENTEQIKVLKNENKAYVSRYSLGRDYHKLIRKRLAQLAKKIEKFSIDHGLAAPTQRGFVDSAPVLERPLAEKSGLGWVGKHSLLIHPEAGSWFFIGELFTSLPIPINEHIIDNKCGDCQACLKVCPTDAFVDSYKLDARRCISYLTIENKGPIPEEFRQPIGNRVFGCDDCQAICPWNKFAHYTQENDFLPRHDLDKTDLADLFLWTEKEFEKKTEGSAIRRIGYERWLRNLAVGLGNAKREEKNKAALKQRLEFPSALVQEHVQWSLGQQENNTRRRRIIASHKWR
ncbi:tRNA epoxyqueuosine(34) reductase QueG [Sessilibacter corallicola]|uniref:tRNA epoxyqueuosine(34) reductase QueG n=1 Tax=Sessilibacter corallicola TaxID=2904075 RepID=UPI00333E8A21